jgi:hypothetical protein
MPPGKTIPIVLILLCVVLTNSVIPILFMDAADLISTLLAQEQVFGAEPNPTDSPIGGGDGYHDIFTSADPRINYTVTTADELLAALRNAGRGDVIYVDEQADINLKNISRRVTIPEGVTIASNRGERKTAGSAVYSFNIEDSNEYAIWGLVSAPDEESNSFWISIDGEKPRQWDLDTGSDWHWSREGSHYLSGGQHTLTIHWREEATGLDGILITDNTDNLMDDTAQETNEGRHISIEAESGELSSPMERISDPAASAGVYISAPKGSGVGEYPISSGGKISLKPADSSHATGLIAGGEYVRITGICLEGPDTTTDTVDQPVLGIFSSYRNLEVDNCEIWGWSGAGVSLYGTGGSDMQSGGYVHHNYIHHCQMNGLGYGVVVSGGSTSLVEANYIDYCRHAIAGSGLPGDGYEARYNICGPNFIASYAYQFDMHGTPDPSGSGTMAGDIIKIHHNTFMATEPTDSYAALICGVPRIGAYIDHNWFYYDQAPPIAQMNGKGKITMTDNLIGQEGVLHSSGPIRYY